MAKILRSFRCQIELWDALTARAGEMGVSTNGLLEAIAAQYLGIAGSDVGAVSEAVSGGVSEAVSAISAELDEVIARVEVLERAIAAKSPTDTSTDNHRHQPTPTPAPTAQTGLLTTGQAYAEAKRRGFDGSLGTFKRWIKQGDRPGGVVPDWEARAKYPAKSNAARWLSFG